MPTPDTDYYSDAGQGPDSQPSETKGGDYQSALLPRSIFGEDVKPGDEITLRAKEVQGDDVICEKCDDKGDKGNDMQHVNDEPSAPETNSTSGMSSMLED